MSTGVARESELRSKVEGYEERERRLEANLRKATADRELDIKKVGETF